MAEQATQEHQYQALEPEEALYTQLASTVLVVVVGRVDGWAAYAGGVPGINHAREWPAVRDHGDKLKVDVALAVCRTYFYPGLDLNPAHYAD